MNDRNRTLAAVAIIFGTVSLVVIGIGVLVTRGSIVSPVPLGDSGSPIKIIFITPTPSPAASISATTKSPTPGDSK